MDSQDIEKRKNVSSIKQLPGKYSKYKSTDGIILDTVLNKENIGGIISSESSEDREKMEKNKQQKNVEKMVFSSTEESSDDIQIEKKKNQQRKNVKKMVFSPPEEIPHDEGYEFQSKDLDNLDSTPKAVKNTKNNTSKQLTKTQPRMKLTSPKTPPSLISVYMEYWQITQSTYSGNIGVTVNTKDELFEDYNRFNDNPVLLNDFNPPKFGYPLSQISINKKTLFQLELDDSNQKMYTSLSATSAPKPHTILYDTNAIKGINCNQLGVGIIPVCTNRCEPQFEWFYEGKPICKGPYLNWIDITRPSSTTQYSCVLTCSKCPVHVYQQEKIDVDGNKQLIWTVVDEFEEEKSVEDMNEIEASTNQEEIYNKGANGDSKIIISKKQTCTDENDKEKMTSIFDGTLMDLYRKEDICFVHSQRFIGCGSQGRVKKGFLFGTPVAIKQILLGFSKSNKNLWHRSYQRYIILSSS